MGSQSCEETLCRSLKEYFFRVDKKIFPAPVEFVTKRDIVRLVLRGGGSVKKRGRRRAREATQQVLNNGSGFGFKNYISPNPMPDKVRLGGSPAEVI
jgi:hypothetical protein